MKNSFSIESRPLPKTFVLELTQRCNHNCLHCYTVWGAPELDYQRNGLGEITTSDFKNIISKLQDEVPVESVALSGGEPLLREDLNEILSFLKKRNLASVIITNGTLLTKEKVAETMVGGTYEVSLLSYRHQLHDSLVKKKGAWNAAVDGMANICKAGGNLVVVFVATKLNYMDLFKTAELAIALGASGLMYNRINLGAFNLRFVDRLMPTPPMIQRNLDMLEELGEKYKLPISVSVVLEPCVIDIQKYKNIHFGWCPLGGEDSYFTIDPFGNVRICNHSPQILGNIKQDSFVDIYYNHPYVQSFRDTWPNDCVECEPQLKDMCRGGCKAAAEQCFGTFERVDPFVALFR